MIKYLGNLIFIQSIRINSCFHRNRNLSIYMLYANVSGMSLAIRNALFVLWRLISMLIALKVEVKKKILLRRKLRKRQVWLQYKVFYYYYLIFLKEKIHSTGIFNKKTVTKMYVLIDLFNFLRGKQFCLWNVEFPQKIQKCFYL